MRLKHGHGGYWASWMSFATDLTCYNGIKGGRLWAIAACNLRANGLNHYFADKAGVMAAMKRPG